MKVNCKECEYWDKTYIRKNEGECRALPATMDSRGYGIWPITKAMNGFCYSGSIKKSELLQEDRDVMENPIV